MQGNNAAIFPRTKISIIIKIRINERRLFRRKPDGFRNKRLMTKRHERLRLFNIATVIILIAMMAVGFALASTWTAYGDGGFEIVETYPRDGATNAAVENLGVKFTFSKDIDAEANREANAKCFTLIGPDGNVLPTKVYYNPKDATQLLVLYDTTETGPLTAGKSEHYQLKVAGTLVNNEGAVLGEDVNIEFDTINQSFNTSVYMVIMLLMMGGMVFFTTRQASKKAAENAQGGSGKVTREEAFNPYKEAKRTGKSVAEVMAIHEKEVAKAEAKASKKNVREYDEDFEEEEYDNGNYKVKGPRPISAGGSSYITGRKALAEAKKAEEERLARRRANAKKKR